MIWSQLTERLRKVMRQHHPEGLRAHLEVDVQHREALHDLLR